MKDDPFVRVVPGKEMKASSAAKVLHVAKGRFPNESLCGKILDPAVVKPTGRVKCERCQISLKNLRSNNVLP